MLRICVGYGVGDMVGTNISSKSRLYFPSSPMFGKNSSKVVDAPVGDGVGRG